MKIVFLGTGEIGVPSLQALAGAHDLCAVYTQPDRPAGRNLALRPSPIKQAAEALGLPVFQPEKIRTPDAVEDLGALCPEVIVVAAYGQILPRSVLEIPSHGCLNLHVSLLPLHRGASPIQAAILAGDAQSGITIMQMDEGLDTGDIILQEPLKIGRHETGGELHDRLGAQAPELLLRTLKAIEHGMASRQKQDGALATYAPKLTREDGKIDWQRDAVEIDRQIRAFSPWPGAFTSFPYQGQSVGLKIQQALLCRRCHGEAGVVLRADARGILIGAGRGAILLRQVQAAGAKRLSAAEFLHGRPVAVGTHFGG